MRRLDGLSAPFQPRPGCRSTPAFPSSTSTSPESRSTHRAETGLEHDFGSAEAALAAGAELVVVTKASCAAYTRAELEVPATSIRDPVSTLGAGDVFHGALLAALVWSSRLAEALALAINAAALSCRALGGRRPTSPSSPDPP